MNLYDFFYRFNHDSFWDKSIDSVKCKILVDPNSTKAFFINSDHSFINFKSPKFSAQSLKSK